MASRLLILKYKSRHDILLFKILWRRLMSFRANAKWPTGPQWVFDLLTYSLPAAHGILASLLFPELTGTLLPRGLNAQLFGCLPAAIWDFAYLTARPYCWLRFLISCTRESPMQTGRWRGSGPSVQVPSLLSSKGFCLCSFLWRHFHLANV